MSLTAHGARAEDYDVFARLFPELGVPDPTPTREQFEARVAPHAFFLWDDARPVAYAFWHALGDVARIGHVIVDPSARGRGVGGALMQELGARARRAGCSRWELHVKPNNVPAIRLYERSGMREVGQPVAMKIAWSDVARLPVEEGTESFLVGPEQEALVEVAVGLLAGHIGVLRAGGGRVFPALRRDQQIVAFAAFDPAFPGAAPFKAARPGLARALLEAMRPHALPEHPYVRVVTEASVAQAMTAAGAETLLDMLRMEGPIVLSEGRVAEGALTGPTR